MGETRGGNSSKEGSGGASPISALELVELLLLEISIFSSCMDRGRVCGLLLRVLGLSPERRERGEGLGMFGGRIYLRGDHLRGYRTVEKPGQGIIKGQKKGINWAKTECSLLASGMNRGSVGPKDWARGKVTGGGHWCQGRHTQGTL